MSFSWTRVGAILVKELRDYRHNRFVIGTIAFLPVLFIALPIVQLLTVSASAASSKLDARVGLSLLYLLVIPATVPSTLSAYSVIGERDQGTLEPILITPIRREEFLVQLLFTPLLAGWSIWVGIAISARSTDVRVAQQLSVFASLPPLALVALMQFKVITPSTGLALALAAVLLIVDGLGWRAVAAMFDRERLLTGFGR